MTEQNDQPVQQEATEAKVESKIADRFASAREAVMKESAELSEIYRSLTKPNVKDVYSAWVKNMDVVANTYSWGKDKPGFKTNMMKIMNRAVGVTAATVTGVSDIAVNTLTWLPRKVPFVRHFMPHDTFKKHTIRMAEAARREALVARGVAKIIDVPGAVIAGALNRSMLGVGPMGMPETRAGWQYMGKKISNVTEAILHPKGKAV